MAEGGWNRGLGVMAVAAVLLLPGATGRGAEELTSTMPQFYYCGLYAVYGAAIREGIQLDFVSLLNSKYMGCPRGSSMRELQLAAQDHGLHALPMGRMTPQMLRRLTKPVVLSVRADLSASEYEHSVLYVSHTDNKYVCLDEDKMRSWTEAELLSRWSGAGMILSKSEIATGAVIAGGWLWSGSWLLGPIIAVACARSLWRWSLPKMGRFGRLGNKVMFQLGGIVVVSCAAAVAYHRTAAAGLLAPDNQVEAVQAAHIGNFIPKLSLSVARSAHVARKATFIDARRAKDYADGHIEGALNIPIDANNAARVATMSAIPRSRPLIVYCQSKGCPSASAVASMLVRDGYTDVSIFVEGWEGWRDNERN